MSFCISAVKSGSIRSLRPMDSVNGVRRSQKLRSKVVFTTKALLTTDTSLDVEKMAPLGDRVLIKPKPADEKTAGGILLTSSANPKMDDALIGSVLAIGEEVDCDVAVGDQVLYTKYGSSDMEGPDGELSFVAQKSILAKLT